MGGNFPGRNFPRTIKNKYLSIRKNAGTELCSTQLEMCAQNLKLIV